MKIKVVNLILYATFLIDFINGIIILEFPSLGLSFGQLIRSIFILILLFIFLQETNLKSRRFLLLNLFGIFIAICEMFSYFQSQNLSGLVIDLQVILKLFLIIIIIMTGTSLIDNYPNVKFRFYHIIKFNIYLVPLLIVISTYLGINKSSYGNDIGNVGTFSLNSFSSAMIPLIVFTIDMIFNKGIKYLFLLVYVAIPFILIGSKSSFIFPIFILIIYFLFSIREGKKIVSYIIFLIITFIILQFLINNYFYEQFINIISRQQQYINISNDNNIFFSYLLSGRDIFFKNLWDKFIDDFGLIKLFFGGGSYLIASAVKPAEMDLFDIFFQYGLIGVVFTYGLVLKVFIKNINKNKFEFTKPYIVSVLCLLIYSILGGHVFTEPLGGTILAICIVGLYYENKKM